MVRNITHTKKVVEEEEDWERSLEAESRAINVLGSINLEGNWIGYNIIHHVEKEGTDKKQNDTEDIQTGDVVFAIEEFKEADPETDNKSLNVIDVAIELE
ncbi:hypothetical protein FXO38_23281 [Capsicum annuum]|nr:hypothetical protein FXO37_35853 [Capsicum annuum]KAF3638324.1 hypothetical protein FXO38_23281 [Capsicum annuum]